MNTFCKRLIVVNNRIREVSQAIFGGLLPPKNIDKLSVKEQLKEEIRLLKNKLIQNNIIIVIITLGLVVCTGGTILVIVGAFIVEFGVEHCIGLVEFIRRELLRMNDAKILAEIELLNERLQSL